MIAATESTLESTGERLLADDFNEYTIEHLHRYGIALQLTAGMSVLDIASGEGYGGWLLANRAKHVIGVDISPEAVEHANKKYAKANLEYRVGSADSIPVESGVLDVVVSFETLEHHDKHNEMMAEISRVLRPGGLLIMSTPDRRFFGGNPYHIKELDLEEFRVLLSTYFSNVALYYQKVYFGSLLVPEKCGVEKCGVEIFKGDYEAIKVESTIVQPVYNVCLASNNSLPTLPCSLFDGLAVWDQFKALKEQAESVSGRLQNLTAVHMRVTKSLSFRIGRLLTFPFRLLGKLLK